MSKSVQIEGFVRVDFFFLICSIFFPQIGSVEASAKTPTRLPHRQVKQWLGIWRTHFSYRTINPELRLLSPPPFRPRRPLLRRWAYEVCFARRSLLRSSPLVSTTTRRCCNPSTSPRPRSDAAFVGGHSIALMGAPVLSTDGGSCPSNSPDVCRSKLAKSTIELKKPFASATMQEEPFNFLRTLCDGMVAGATAGVVVETVLYPIDTIKTRLQAAHGGSKIHWKGLYSGLAGNLAGVLPASAIFVGIYEPTKQQLVKMFPENLSAIAHLTAGAIGGFAASLIRVPTEVVKQRMQTGQFTSAPNAVRLIAAKEGIGGLYAGYSSFLLRDLPFDAIQFCIYEQLRIGYKIAARRELSDPENALIGAFAGAITGAVTTPLDVLKTRLMVQGSASQYKGLINCAQTILKEEGPAAFLKGIGPRVLWIGIGGSIFFGVLERTKLLLSQRHFDQRIKS